MPSCNVCVALRTPLYHSEKSTSHTLVFIRAIRDEKQVQDMINTIQSFINPWASDETRLISLVSGVIASPDVEESLLSAGSSGEAAYLDFQNDRLLSSKVDFFSPIKANKLKTFDKIGHSRLQTKQQAKTNLIKTDRSIFARLLVISRSRFVDLKEIMCYPLNSVSLPLATADGQISKTVKSQLLQALESECQNIDLDIPKDSAVIMDAMAVVQSLPIASLPSTFGQLSKLILLAVAQKAKSCNASRVDFVIDRYLEKSIKESERLKRTGWKSTTGPGLKISNGDIAVPKQWKSFLASGHNKTELLKFLAFDWRECTLPNFNITIFSTCLNDCNELRFFDGKQPTLLNHSELNSDHEEADTRMIAHALHAQKTHNTVLVASPDTDVAILCLGHSSKFVDATLGFLTGTKMKRRIINLTQMAAQLGSQITASLIGMHAFSGCDTC